MCGSDSDGHGDDGGESNPPRHGEGDRREAVVEGPFATKRGPRKDDSPLRQRFALPPPRTGEYWFASVHHDSVWFAFLSISSTEEIIFELIS